MLGRCRQYGHPRLLEVTEERNGLSGLRDDDDDDDDYTNKDKRLQFMGLHPMTFHRDPAEGSSSRPLLLMSLFNSVARTHTGQ